MVFWTTHAHFKSFFFTVFFKIQKNTSCCTRFLEHCSRLTGGRRPSWPGNVHVYRSCWVKTAVACYRSLQATKTGQRNASSFSSLRLLLATCVYIRPTGIVTSDCERVFLAAPMSVSSPATTFVFCPVWARGNPFPLIPSLLHFPTFYSTF